MVYYALVQSILACIIAFWGLAYHVNVNKLETTLNSLLKYLFNFPRLFPTSSLYKELEILNINSLHLLYVCKHKSIILLPIHTHSTHY